MLGLSFVYYIQHHAFGAPASLFFMELFSELVQLDVLELVKIYESCDFGTRKKKAVDILDYGFMWLSPVDHTIGQKFRKVQFG